MSNVIYLVTESGGEYEDSWTHNIVATHDFDFANRFMEYAALANTIDAEVAELVDEVKGRHNESTVAIPYEDDEEYPKWASGVRNCDITPEMRAVRNAVIERNKAKNEANWALNDARDDKIRQAVIQELVLQGFSVGVIESYIDDHRYPWDQGKTFEIEAVPLQ